MNVAPSAKGLGVLAACIGAVAGWSGAAVAAVPELDATRGIEVPRVPTERVSDVTKVLPDPIERLVPTTPAPPTLPSQTPLPSPAAPPSPSAPARTSPAADTTAPSRGRSGGTARGDRAIRTRSTSRDAPRGRSGSGPTRRPAVGSIGEAASASGDRGDATSAFAQALRDVVEVIPTPIKIALAALGALALGFGVASLATALRARRLRRDREELLQDVGLLQRALLPEVADRVGGLAASVAYRPADGPAAGGDFYDVFQLADGRVAIIVGDVSGHGRQALARTTLMRYTLRAYLDAGLPPKSVLQLAGGVLENDFEDEFTTVAVAIYDPAETTLTYACAGHPPPLVPDADPRYPLTTCSSPPIGLRMRTGLRQTTLFLRSGSLVCFYTDGVVDARRAGQTIGRERLEELVADLGPGGTAQMLLGRLAEEADETPDDMAMCVVRPLDGSSASDARIEELDLDPSDLDGELPDRFLEACGVPPSEVRALSASLRATTSSFGGAVLRVLIEDGRSEAVVLPRNVESLAAASRGVTALAGATRV
jgi:hypothetical protein